MTRPFLPVSSKPEANGRFGNSEFEPLLNSEQAAELLQIHHKTLQKLARRGEIHGSQVGKLWRFRVSDLNACFDSNQHVGQPKINTNISEWRIGFIFPSDVFRPRALSKFLIGPQPK